MRLRRTAAAVLTILGVTAGVVGMGAPAYADKTWTQSGCTLRAVAPYYYRSGNTKNFVARTSLSCQYKQPSIKVKIILYQYRALNNWSAKKTNELRANSVSTASVAATWRCSGGTQTYRAYAQAWWGRNDEYSKSGWGESVRLTC
ncbi:hypothetical protein ACOZ38_36535 [Sphaerisporangium viridialbum]|uniref:hypothetical protein n=1 Tax=Sphaerisporangium viridialbum TaxID=46189 RepID=UPI003C7487ED